jgi:hypothetical protein
MDAPHHAPGEENAGQVALSGSSQRERLQTLRPFPRIEAFWLGLPLLHGLLSENQNVVVTWGFGPDHERSRRANTRLLRISHFQADLA